MSEDISLNNMTIDEIKEGMEASYTQEITDADIRSFAEVSGDKNPVHLSPEYAENSQFKKRIAHGLMTASFFSALFGTRLPGVGSIYVSQSLQFKRPVYLGDTVTATVIVQGVDVEKRRVFFRTVCKVNNKIVTDGMAEIYMP